MTDEKNATSTSLEHKKFKLHIDSNLIKSNTSILPDELKDLGVCAFDENDFERGVLLQVDCQIAEYELNTAKDKLLFRKIDRKGVETDESSSLSSNSNDIDSTISNSLKRKLTHSDEKVNLNEKKARLESVLNDYNDYLNSQDKDDDKSTSKSILFIK